MPAMPTPQGQPYYQSVPMHNQRPPSNVKHFEGWDYCWSHGCDVSHTSAQCTRPKAGHMWNATRSNTMGGSMNKSYKTIMPSAVGRTGARRNNNGGGNAGGGYGGGGPYNNYNPNGGQRGGGSNRNNNNNNRNRGSGYQQQQQNYNQQQHHGNQQQFGGNMQQQMGYPPMGNNMWHYGNGNM